MEEAFKKLWSAVLQQALRDAQGNYYSYREEAREWLLSENHETASFLWVCDVLSLDPDLFRNAYRQEWKTRGYCKPAKEKSKFRILRKTFEYQKYGK